MTSTMTRLEASERRERTRARVRRVLRGLLRREGREGALREEALLRLDLLSLLDLVEHPAERPILLLLLLLLVPAGPSEGTTAPTAPTTPTTRRAPPLLPLLPLLLGAGVAPRVAPGVRGASRLQSPLAGSRANRARGQRRALRILPLVEQLDQVKEEEEASRQQQARGSQRRPRRMPSRMLGRACIAPVSVLTRRRATSALAAAPSGSRPDRRPRCHPRSHP